jgi:hypothetical protein
MLHKDCHVIAHLSLPLVLKRRKGSVQTKKDASNAGSNAEREEADVQDVMKAGST